MPTPAPVSSAIDARFVSLASSTLIYHHCFDFACHAMRVQPGTTARPGSPRIRCASDPCNIISPSLSQSLSPSPSPSLRLFHSWICAVHGLGQSLSLSLSHSFDRSIALDSTSSVQSMLWNGMACGGEDGLPHLLQICAKYFYFVRPQAMASGSARMRHKSSGTHRGSAGAGVARQRVHHKCDFVVLLRLQSPRRS